MASRPPVASRVGAAAPPLSPSSGLLRGAAVVEALRGAADALGADTCSLMVAEPGQSDPGLYAAYGLDQRLSRDAHRTPGRGIGAYVLASGQPVILGHPQHDPRIEALGVTPRGDIKSSLCVPITLRDGSRGVVNFNRVEAPDGFSHGELQLGCAIAALLGRCISRGGEDAPAAPAASPRRRGPAVRSDLRRSRDSLRRLYAGAQRIGARLDPHHICEQTAQAVAAIAGFRAGLFVPLDEVVAAAIAAAGDGVAVELSEAATAAAVHLRRPAVITADSASASPELVTLAAELTHLRDSRSLLLVPCDDGQGPLGLIVANDGTRALDAAAAEIAGALCAYGGARLRETLKRQAANARSLELSALYQLCGEISAATTIESALRSVLEMAHSMVRYDEGLVFLWNEDAARLELAACRGADFEATRMQAPQERPGNIYEWVFAEGKAFISTDITQPGQEGDRSPQLLRSSMAVPLVVGNETIGVLAIHSAAPQAYAEEHVKVVSIIASQAAAIYRALQSLGRLSRYTDKILQSIVAGVVGLDRAGRVVMWSPAAARIFGREAAAAVGWDFLRLATDIARSSGSSGARTLESLGLAVRRVLAHGEPVLEHDLTLQRDGRPPRTLLADCTPLRDSDGQLVGAVVLVEDVTERKRMQDRIRQMSQLAAVGHLAANVAHEIRNPLSAIKTAAQFLHTEYSAEPLISQFSGIIDEECDRLNKVATDFLNFARPTEPALSRVSLPQVIESALAVIASELNGRDITVNWAPPSRLPRVWADADAMRQVFVNLLVNAAQAIGEHGSITVGLRVVALEPEGRAVEALISDTGCGIGDADLERIWTPFFSTKAKGTGLGLSIVRKTIESHGGQVWAQDCRGGATFGVRLPLASARTAPVPSRTPLGRASRPTPPAHWRQLALDDDRAGLTSGDDVRSLVVVEGDA